MKTHKKNDKMSMSPVAVSLKLLHGFIQIAISKKYLTEEQCKEIAEEMALPLGIKI